MDSINSIGLTEVSDFCESNLSDNDGESDITEMTSYDPFVPIFEAIYCNFIEENRALMEINISGRVRKKIKLIYDKMQENKQKQIEKNKAIMYGKNNSNSNNNNNNNNKNNHEESEVEIQLINKEEFWNLWTNLLVACKEVLGSLQHSYGRCDVAPLLSIKK